MAEDLQRGCCLALLGLFPLICLGLVYAVLGEPYRPVFKRHRLNNLPRSWPNVSIVHISDLHVRRGDQRLLRAQRAALKGLAPDLRHPLQVAWVEADVPQCGYCQSGQIMAAAVLLRETPRPTDADIDEAMCGNICRCGTYPRIRKAIHAAAELAAKGGSR